MKRVISEDLIQWYKVHDFLLGINYQCIVTALNISNKCKYPDAIHLNEILYMVPLTEIINTLKERKDDKIALYFYGMLTNDYLAIEKSAKLGYMHAKRIILHDEFSLELYNLGERKSVALSDKKDDLIYAAELGHVYAMMRLRNLYHKSTTLHWKWCCLEAKTRRLMGVIFINMGRFDFFDFNTSIRYMIGETYKYLCCKGSNYLIEYYNNQNKFYRSMVDTWSIIAIRLKIIKDMRIFIGKMIWEGRRD